MKISAIICEYSPFHYGHEYLIKEAKKNSDAVIAIMSGGFTERGEVAITSKYRRARMAIMGGADLVLELPFPFSCAGNEKFASGGVQIAELLGCVDEIVCGSEVDDENMIMETAKKLLSKEFLKAVDAAKGNNHNKSYADMYFGIYKSIFGDTDIFEGSNNILAIAYAKSLIQLKSNIQLRTIKRIGKDFSGSGIGIESGTSLRAKILNGVSIEGLVPSYVYDEIMDAIKDNDIFDTSNLFLPLAGLFRMTESEDFLDTHEINDELYNRIKNAFATSKSFDEVIEKSKTKQFTASKVRRAIIYSIIGVGGWDVEKVQYTQLLASNEIGRDILKSIKKTKKIDIVTKPADYNSKAYDLAKKADSLLMLTRKEPETSNKYITASPINL